MELFNYLLHCNKFYLIIENSLKNYEEILFVSFQRYTESNHSYISLQLFLILSFLSNKIEIWKKRLRIILFDSQFFILLAHIIEKSTDRKCINNAIYSLTQIFKFEIETEFSQTSLIIDSITSGFLTLNYNEKEIEKNKYLEFIKQISEQSQTIIELKKQIEINDFEIKEIKDKSEEALIIKNESINKFDEFNLIINSKDEIIEQLKLQLIEKEKEINIYKENINQIKEENRKNQEIATISTEKAKFLKNLLKNNEELQKNYIQSEKDKISFEEKNKELILIFNEQKKIINENEEEINELKIKLKNLKNEFSTKSNDFQNQEHIRKQYEMEINQLKEKIEILEKEKLNEIEKSNLLKTKLKEVIIELENMSNIEIDLKKKIDNLLNKNLELNEIINQFNIKEKDFNLLITFLHKITDNNNISTEKLISWLDNNNE